MATKRDNWMGGRGGGRGGGGGGGGPPGGGRGGGGRGGRGDRGGGGGYRDGGDRDGGGGGGNLFLKLIYFQCFCFPNYKQADSNFKLHPHHSDIFCLKAGYL